MLYGEIDMYFKTTKRRTLYQIVLNLMRCKNLDYVSAVWELREAEEKHLNRKRLENFKVIAKYVWR